ncbi:EPIDERMAL PATTERNING FACTOR-like protein 6 isoform X1 [Arachis stenosperma]|uniref:EPIDERMAL PATTERNING FACTOR-like protein 6 isoform X1 n=1 Tax=Arachis stenosperma TaxID=217475 RepID=UPI0025AB6C81|nr:EPIDERMAL PATTERNING FACTOR-like protein 6 isoform X1 [Arachis stenosperma]XP_057731604.1 EPIDERMAL PATTERNING FACTOR-like protein 6 isoform X1 [Arachis stenosperma]
MKGRFLCFLIVLQSVSWVSVAKRPFSPDHAMSHPGTNESAAPKCSPPYTTIESEKKMKSLENWKAVKKIGSSPPSCEHKCYGCTPCEAIQVPSTGKRTHLAIHYANYEPESWRCKCGPFFYSP